MVLALPGASWKRIAPCIGERKTKLSNTAKPIALQLYGAHKPVQLGLGAQVHLPSRPLSKG